MPAYFNIREAAEYLGISPFTLYKLVQRREVPAAKVGGSWRLSKEALDTFISSRSAIQMQRVLIVEPDASMRPVLQSAIRRRASESAVAATTTEAIDRATGMQPDVVFLSVSGNGKDAARLIRQLRETSAGTRVVVMVDPANTSAISGLLDEGPIIVMRKPSTPDEMTDALTLMAA